MAKPPKKSPPSHPRQTIIECLKAFAIFIFIGLIVYWPALNGPYIWDDVAMLRAGKGSGGLRAVWTGKLVDYVPITSTVLWAGWHIWGDNPAGFRLLNLVLHAANAALIYALLRRLKCPGAWIGAGIFFVHPVCVGTVAWIAEIKNTLSLFFALLTLLAYWTALKNSKRQAELPSAGESSVLRLLATREHLLALVSFTLALLSKISVVMLPFALMGLDYWREQGALRPQSSPNSDGSGVARGRTLQRIGVTSTRAAPFFLLSFILGIVSVWFQTHHAMAGANPTEGRPILTRLLAGGYGLWFYLWKALVPLNLMPVYPARDVHPSFWLDWAPAVLWIAALGLCWRLSQIDKPRLGGCFRAAFFGLGFFTLMLIPVLGPLQISYFYISTVADHFQYLPMVGVIAAVAYCLPSGFRKEGVTVVAGAVILVLACASWRRADLFGHPEELWRNNLAKNPRAAMAWANLAEIQTGTSRFDEALNSYGQSLELDPDNLNVRESSASALAASGRLDRAITEYRALLLRRPQNPGTRNHLGAALAVTGKYAEAAVEFKTALELSPDFLEARKNLGAAYSRLGRYDEAIKELQQVLQSQPHYPMAEHLLSEAQRKKIGDGK